MFDSNRISSSGLIIKSNSDKRKLKDHNERDACFESRSFESQAVNDNDENKFDNSHSQNPLMDVHFVKCQIETFAIFLFQVVAHSSTSIMVQPLIQDRKPINKAASSIMEEGLV